MKSLGCTVYDPEAGARVYDPQRNPLLIAGVTATTFLFGFAIKQKQDNSQHATPEATDVYVRMLNAWFGGGYSIATPETGLGGLFGFGRAVWSAPKQMIARPDGTTFAAGLISSALGDEGNYANERMRDAGIYALAGLTDDERDFRLNSSKLVAKWFSDVLISEAQNA